MRILHVIQPDRGGADAVVRLLVQAQGGRHDIGVVCPPGAPLARAAATSGARVWELPMVRPIQPRTDLAHLVRLTHVIRRFKPDLIHAHSSKAGVLARLAGAGSRVPVVYSPHNFAYRAHEGGVFARSAYLTIERAMRPLTSVLHVSCRDEYHDALARRMVSPARCAMVHNGIDISLFAEVATPVEPPLVLGTYSRLSPQKGVDNLIKAVAQLRQPTEAVRCVVIGGGPLEMELRELVARLAVGSIVEFVADPGDARTALSKMHVFVLASYSEAYPLGLMEAMAAGRAVVASSVGGVPEMIRDHETGLLVAPGDPGALAAALNVLLADGDLRSKLGSAARAEAARRFGYMRMAERLEVVYEEALRLGHPVVLGAGRRGR